MFAAGALCLAPGVARAQWGGDSSTTAIYARTGYVLTSFDPSSMNFLPQHTPRDAVPGGMTGKMLGLDREMALSGFQAGIAFDARWFYVRVGADIYEFPEIDGGAAATYRARFTTLAWASAGPRVRVGPIVLNAGVRVGALFMNVTERRTNREYSAVGGVYALDVGLQWRPLRWLEIDTSVGQDFFSPTGATTFSIAANFGWSRSPAPPPAPSR